MNSLIIVIFISFFAGAMSYMIAKFWLLPIFRYHQLRQLIDAELAVCKTADDAAVAKWLSEKKETLRRHSVSLSNANYDLPHWYKLVLSQRAEFHDKAADDLMKLSNTSNPEHARKRVEHVIAFLAPKS
jgi:hypothetical protein